MFQRDFLQELPGPLQMHSPVWVGHLLARTGHHRLQALPPQPPLPPESVQQDLFFNFAIGVLNPITYLTKVT